MPQCHGDKQIMTDNIMDEHLGSKQAKMSFSTTGRLKIFTNKTKLVEIHGKLRNFTGNSQKSECFFHRQRPISRKTSRP